MCYVCVVSLFCFCIHNWFVDHFKSASSPFEERDSSLSLASSSLSFLGLTTSLFKLCKLSEKKHRSLRQLSDEIRMFQYKVLFFMECMVLFTMIVYDQVLAHCI